MRQRRESMDRTRVGTPKGAHPSPIPQGGSGLVGEVQRERCVMHADVIVVGGGHAGCEAALAAADRKSVV